MAKRVQRTEAWKCAKCRRVYGANESYHETPRGAYWCERCARRHGKAITVAV